MSRVSVIIPCYGYGHLLWQCVESVLHQPDVDVRVLILDDASPDETPAVASAILATEARRVEYRRHRVNRGHIATYNEGLAWADGEYTLLLSADDLLTPGALSRAAQLLDANPEVGFVYGGSVTFTTGGPLPGARTPSGRCAWRIRDGMEWLESVCRAGHVYIRSPEVVVRTGLQQTLGGYRADLPHSGDSEMWMRFAVHGAVGEIVDADQAYYRLHGQNMHQRQFSEPLTELRQRKAAFDAVFDTFGERIPGRARLRAEANRRLAREAFGAASAALDRGGQSHATFDAVDELVDFGLRTSGQARLTLEYVGLRSRLLLGPRSSFALRTLHSAAVPARLAGVIETGLRRISLSRAGSSRGTATP
jgi:glycosyltransferase involved in cell wall biosynthesis